MLFLLFILRASHPLVAVWSTACSINGVRQNAVNSYTHHRHQISFYLRNLSLVTSRKIESSTMDSGKWIEFVYFLASNYGNLRPMFVLTFYKARKTTIRFSSRALPILAPMQTMRISLMMGTSVHLCPTNNSIMVDQEVHQEWGVQEDRWAWEGQWDLLVEVVQWVLVHHLACNVVHLEDMEDSMVHLVLLALVNVFRVLHQEAWVQWEAQEVHLQTWCKDMGTILDRWDHISHKNLMVGAMEMMVLVVGIW